MAEFSPQFKRGQERFIKILSPQQRLGLQQANILTGTSQIEKIGGSEFFKIPDIATQQKLAQGKFFDPRGEALDLPTIQATAQPTVQSAVQPTQAAPQPTRVLTEAQKTGLQAAQTRIEQGNPEGRDVELVEEAKAGGFFPEAPTPEIPRPGIADISDDVTGIVDTSGSQPPKVQDNTADFESLFNSVSQDLIEKRTAFESSLQKQLDDLKTQREETQAKIDEFTAKQEGILGEAEEFTTPFQAELEENERKRLKVEENFFENQKLSEELGSLLTEGNDLVRQMKETTGLAAIRNPRINKTISDISARAGVIEAVMSARNNQISVAENLIDRSVNAINADRTSQLNYYNSLLGFYGGLKDEEGNKLVSITNDEKKFVNAQISLLENDLAQSQAVANQIKQAMTDPATAAIYGQAGISLNDTPQEINQKLSNYTFQQDNIRVDNEMADNGFEFIPEGTLGSRDPEGIRIKRDSQGNERTYWKDPAVTDKDFELRTVGGKIIRTNPQTGETEVIFEGEVGDDDFTTQQKFSNTFKIRSELLAQSKDFQKIRSSWGRIQSAAKDPSAAGDLAIIFNFMKILDPGSVVRESEFATAENAAGVPQRIRNWWNKVLYGTRLGAATQEEKRLGLDSQSREEAASDASSQRADFVNTAKGLFESELSTQKERQAESRRTAESFNLDPNQAVPDLTGEGQPLDETFSFTNFDDYFDSLSAEEQQSINNIQIEFDIPNEQDLFDFIKEQSDFNQVGSDTQAATGNIISQKVGTRNIKVDDSISDKIAQADKEFFEATGKHILINQSFRSREQQAELFRRSQAGEIGRAAPPGKSFHEKGLAIDVTNWKEAEKFLRKFGFKNNLADDKGHFSIGEFA